MRQVININEKWAFTKDTDEIPKEMPKRWCWVHLPHTWNNIDGQDGNNDYYRGTGYYAKMIKRAELPKADKYFLEIRGANSSADIYVDGRKLAHHDGGYSTWRVDITKELKEESLLVITVDNSQNDSVYPQMADFTFYGGLYRDVNIIGVSAAHFDLEYCGGEGLQVTPVLQGNDAEITIETWITEKKEGQNLVYKIRDRQGKLVAEKRCSAADRKIQMKINNVHRWNGRKDPYLYYAEVELTENGKILDNVYTRFGCRTFEIHPEKGFLLNGESYPLRGVSRHQDRWGIGNALLPKHHKEDMDLICELGATTIRLAHYQHDQYFYDLCDERGMVVWAEIPYISAHLPNGGENTVSQMKELIIQNYHHPSIVVWGLSNEITMQDANEEDLLENHKILNDLCHEMDSTRLTTMAVVSMCDIHHPYIQIPDVVSYNHYFGWYGGDVSMNGPWLDNFHKEFPQIPIGVSEYGCEALNWHTSEPQQGDYTEEYQAYYHEELIKQLFTRPYLWATHVWNMFDFGADARNEGGENGQNHKGLVTFDRKYKKDAFYAYKAWLSHEPFVHICGKRYVNRVEEKTKITVYSNFPEVTLYLNGQEYEKQVSDEHFFYFTVPNKGETIITAKAGACKDQSFIRKTEKFDEAYRLKEKGAVLNWFDIEEAPGYYSLNDKVSEILKSKQGKALFEHILGTLLNRNVETQDEKAKKKAEDMMQMLGSFTVLRMINTMGAIGEKMTKEQLLELNSRLNQIQREN